MAVNDIVMGAAGASGPATFVEDVFSCFLYTGNDTARTITNGIDLSGKGGMVWCKNRTTAGTFNLLFDTIRGATKVIYSNATNAQATYADSLTGFTSTGFTLGNDASGLAINGQGNVVSWTFREQPKFFDIVTYTGNGVAGRSIAHSLGSKPGCILVKRTSATSSWAVWHRAYNSGDGYGFLESTSAFSTDGGGIWGDGSTHIEPTSTDFTINSNYNGTGSTYVAYLFAHNAGGFGATGTDNVISCGSFNAGDTVNLGYEPQWIMRKRSDNIGSWEIYDTMRGLTVSTGDRELAANSASAESAGDRFDITATGFTDKVSVGTYIYIAIRRPMKTPTTGTEVYATDTAGGTLPNPPLYNSGWPVDFGWFRGSMPNSSSNDWYDRLRGQTQTLFTNSTSQEQPYGGGNFSFDSNTGWSTQSFTQSDYRAWMFRRAPGFFDVVCWTGDGTNPRSLNHNLTVVPELIITKRRSTTSNWITGYDFTSTTYKYFFLNDAAAATSDTYASSPVYGGIPTTSVFVVGNQGQMNASAATYVTYLFATVANVSKVGSYTGNGSSQTINCGFTTGARFIMIKCTSATGDWKVIDSARGIIAGNDPTLALNTTAAEVTGTDCIDPDSSGFIVNQETTNNLNVNAASYIFLAIS